MAITASDVVSNDDVRSIVDKLRNQKYQARRAFRRHDGTSLNSNTFNFPVSDNDLDGEVAEVGESSTYPRGSLSWSEVSAVYTKYGVEIPISDEAVDDSAIDVVLNAQEDIIRAEENRMDTLAFNILSNNTNSNGPIDENSNTTIEWDDIVAAKERAFVDELDMGSLALIGSGLDMSDYLTMNEFTSASELGDQVIQQGVLPGGDLIGQEGLLGVAGDIPVYLSNAGTFTEGQAFLVDTNNFGWESVRWETEVKSYREEDKDQDVWKIRGRWDWVATDSSANIEINVT